MNARVREWKRVGGEIESKNKRETEEPEKEKSEESFFSNIIFILFFYLFLPSFSFPLFSISFTSLLLFLFSPPHYFSVFIFHSSTSFFSFLFLLLFIFFSFFPLFSLLFFVLCFLFISSFFPLSLFLCFFPFPFLFLFLSSSFFLLSLFHFFFCLKREKKNESKKINSLSIYYSGNRDWLFISWHVLIFCFVASKCAENLLCPFCWPQRWTRIILFFFFLTHLKPDFVTLPKWGIEKV